MDTIRSARDILLEAMHIKTLVDNLDGAAIPYLQKKLRCSPRFAALELLRLVGVTRGQLRLAQHKVEQHNTSALRRDRTGKSLRDLPQMMTLTDAIRTVAVLQPMDPREAIRIAQPADHHKATMARLVAIARLSATPDNSLRSALIGHWRPSLALTPLHDLIELANHCRIGCPDEPLTVITEEAGRFWEEPGHYVIINQQRARLRTQRGQRRTRKAA